MTGKQDHEDPGHVYGPVPSRRLGLSLGVDLIPFKTCTFDCIYCQLGRTTCKTLRRAEYVPVADILDELEQVLSEAPCPDYITLAGSGEPTLHSGLGDIIEGIRSMTSLPVAVITNGSLFQDPGVRRACGLADVVLPSLDAGDEKTFRAVNRPAAGLTYGGLLEGLISFRREYDGAVWLEVFLVHPFTGSDPEVERIAREARPIRPDRIHLNTVVRPAAASSTGAVPAAEMERFAKFFEPTAICDFPSPREVQGKGVSEKLLLETLRRRPSTLDDIAATMNAPPTEIIKKMDRLIAQDQVDTIRRGGRIYYMALPDTLSGGEVTPTDEDRKR